MGPDCNSFCESHFVLYFVVSPLHHGTPASDIPKDEEMADLIGDDEDSPAPTVSPPDKSQQDQQEDLTVLYSHPSGKPCQLLA